MPPKFPVWSHCDAKTIVTAKNRNPESAQSIVFLVAALARYKCVTSIHALELNWIAAVQSGGYLQLKGVFGGKRAK